MPARWHALTASGTSGRTGSWMPTMPTKIRSFSGASSRLSDSSGRSMYAMEMVRSASVAYLLMSLLISSRTFSFIGSTSPVF